MRSGMLPARIVHVHPTRMCNLACAHCYSSSSPTAGPSLEAKSLGRALSELREEGYEVLSISGGEPLAYRDLSRLAGEAAASGYKVHLVTNGILLTPRRARALKEHVRLIAVSFDGAEALHDEVRGRGGVFRKANVALEVLAATGIPFGMVFGVSRRSLPDVPWAFERAREVGADLLHLRPLVAEGRARTMANDWMLSPEDLARLAVVGELLGSGTAGRPRVQVDVVPRASLEHARAQFALLQEDHRAVSLSEVANPLVITEDGRLLPFTYGIHPSYGIARLGPGWQADASRITANPQSITELLEESLLAAMAGDAPYLDWFAHLTTMSHALGDRGAVQLVSPCA